MTEKFKQVSRYSNPRKVLVLAKKLGYDTDLLFISKVPQKKYTLVTPKGSKVHFGEVGYEDFTKHNDLERRRRFRQRNHNWALAPKYSPARLSYDLLW